MRDRDHGLALGFVMSFAAAAVLLVDTPTARACGCLSPPAVTEGQFAVNQRAEQIIFEVEPGWVTAHVLIKYAGDPSKFAWIVPVPEVPELAISPLTAFGLLDQMTAPQISVGTENICPVSEYVCMHNNETCGDFASGDDGPFPIADAGAFDGATQPGGGVTVIDEQTVGDYQTVTFRASEASAAVQWLHDNGFVVNNTTSIYMESYVQAGMVFVAAKLVPGAGVRSIKPLRLRYRAAYPTVPLVLTAVAAQPNLTVTSFVYASKPFKPQGHPIVAIDAKRIAQDKTGRINYPMVMARQIDEAGGDGFVIEYRGASQKPQFGSMSAFCCETPSDPCNIGHDQQCQCPRDELDYGDCSQVSDLVDGVKLLDDLATKYPAVTRITTRVSAEEMTFDPAFEADFNPNQSVSQFLFGSQASLLQCGSAVIDQNKLRDITAIEACATVYCGAGQCVATAEGAGCACDAGYVAQQFDDLDGKPSVTCVPQTPPCDLRAGGDALPDACANVGCGAGVCQDRNGVAVCACNAGAGAVTTLAGAPTCVAYDLSSQTPGAEDYSEQLRDLEVCAPALPECDGGWYEKRTSPRPGVACGAQATPSPLQMIPKSGPSCGGFFGCGGCSEAPDGAPIGSLVGAGTLFFALVVRRRRR